MEDDIIFLVKLGKKEFLEDIRKGRIRFTRLEYYQNIENKNIGDINEGMESIIHTDNKTNFFFSHPSINNGIQLDVTNSIVSMVNFPNNNYYIFCLAYFTVSDIYNKTIFDNKIYNEKQWPDVLLFTNPRSFLETVINKIRDYSPMIGPVKYFDIKNSQHSLGVLDKSMEFAHQKEYRIAFDMPKENGFERIDNDTIIIDVGNIESNTMIVPKENLEEVTQRCLLPNFDVSDRSGTQNGA